MNQAQIDATTASLYKPFYIIGGAYLICLAIAACGVFLLLRSISRWIDSKTKQNSAPQQTPVVTDFTAVTPQQQDDSKYQPKPKS